MLFFDEKRLSLFTIISITDNDNRLLDGIVEKPKRFALMKKIEFVLKLYVRFYLLEIIIKPIKFVLDIYI